MNYLFRLLVGLISILCVAESHAYSDTINWVEDGQPAYLTCSNSSSQLICQYQTASQSGSFTSNPGFFLFQGVRFQSRQPGATNRVCASGTSASGRIIYCWRTSYNSSTQTLSGNRDLGNLVAEDSDGTTLYVGDLILDQYDNCDYVINTDQLNTDNDQYGNACDSDDDNDGVLDVDDKFPLDASRWQIVRHSSDIDNDSDVLVRSASTGSWTRHTVQNAAITGTGSMNAYTSSSVQYVAQLDANGDGDADILTRNTSTGAWYLHQVQSGAVTSTAPIYLYANLDQQFIGAGDFNNDGTDDIVIRGTGASADGKWWNFRMSNFSSAETTNLNTFLNKTQVSFAASGDYNGDGHTDMLIRVNNGPVYVARIVNGVVSGSTLLLTSLPADQVVLK